MTDTYGSGPHDHEHDMAEGHDAEGWHGDHPPVDDFADHATDQVSEETASVSEESSEHGDDAVTQAVEAGGRSLPILPIAAGVGLILLLGAGLYWQFGVSKSPSAMQAAMTPSAPAAMPVVNPQNQPTPSMTPGAVTAPAIDVAPTTNMPSATPVVQPIPAIQPPVTPTANPVVTPSTASVTASPVSPALEGRLNTLSNKVVDMEKSLDQATQKLTQVAAMMNNQAGATASSPALDERLTKIEQQLNQMEHKTRLAAKPAASADANDTNLIDMSSTPKPVESLANRGASHKPRHMAASRSPKSSHNVKPAVAAQAAAASRELWVLRAASPNEAWVAKDVNTSELRHIQVGDSLPGIGQIQAIHQTGNGWTIEGSQGTIH